jgi:hypothetical protein
VVEIAGMAEVVADETGTAAVVKVTPQAMAKADAPTAVAKTVPVGRPTGTRTGSVQNAIPRTTRPPSPRSRGSSACGHGELTVRPPWLPYLMTSSYWPGSSSGTVYPVCERL